VTNLEQVGASAAPLNIIVLDGLPRLPGTDIVMPRLGPRANGDEEAEP
jgi:hypothetical protein